MLDSRPFWALAARIPCAFTGGTLHRAALAALARGHHEEARRLLAHAALKYRAEMRVEPLARLRVHELIVQARAAPGTDPSLALEIERRLARLDRIESLDPPFELRDAHLMLAGWLAPVDPATGAEKHAEILRAA